MTAGTRLLVRVPAAISTSADEKPAWALFMLLPLNQTSGRLASGLPLGIFKDALDRKLQFCCWSSPRRTATMLILQGRLVLERLMLSKK